MLAGAPLLLVMAACSGTLVPVTPAPGAAQTSPGSRTGEPAAPEPTPTGAPAASPSGSDSTRAVELSVDTAAGAKEFRFVQTSLDAPTGATITLTFSNMTDPADEVGHDWVLVKPGQEQSVLASALAAGDARDWLDETDPGIIAATRLIEGGQRDTVTFAAPPPGTYTFLCTVPDRYAGGMQGTLTIH